ncbi:hypothetical protein [uncultured Chryseobacterium sp.]|uniref:hypothetical protein n=1 Tax=uncultured Chryseobacterium sp. TaxID=259322 RepID=UPI0025F63CA1|nr:hypothetical protein [uncultured Chryseobacterium sp.]
MKTINHYLLKWDLTNDTGTITLNMMNTDGTGTESQKIITDLSFSKFNMLVAILENGITTFDQTNNTILNIVRK